MRRQSSCLVMAANQNSGIDVFFGAEFNFRVQIPNFRRAHHYKISKNHFSGSQHQKSLFTRACLRLLSVSVTRKFCPCLLVHQVTATRNISFGGVSVTRTIPHMFTCQPRKQAAHTLACHQISYECV